MGPIWGRQDPDGPHVDPMNFVIWDMCNLAANNKRKLFHASATSIYDPPTHAANLPIKLQDVFMNCNFASSSIAVP